MSDSERSVSFGDGTQEGSTINGKWRCDHSHPNVETSPGWIGAAWYRITMPAGTHIPESSPGRLHCGTHATGWLVGTHPTSTGESVDVDFCFARDEDNDCRHSNKGKITNCGEYFVYYLENTPDCSYRYCATN